MLKVYIHELLEEVDYRNQGKSLPIAIQERIEKRKNKQKAISSWAGYLLLQKTLKENYALSLEDINYQPSGKPFFATKKCFFSISHSQKSIGVALSDQSEVGLDIEHNRDLSIGENSFAFFSDVEKKVIQNDTNPSLKMIEFWSKKEALIKAVGGRMFDMANHTDVREDTMTWKGERYFLEQLGQPPNLHIWLATKVLNTDLLLEEVKSL